jgi:methyl-accepting chemotaxis protein
MKIKLKIQQKIQLFIISSSILIYLVAIGYISINARKMAYNLETENVKLQASNAAKDIKAIFDGNMAIVKTLAEAYRNYTKFPLEEWKSHIKDFYYEVFKENPDVYSLWDSWELNAVDPTWKKPTGRFVTIHWREDGKILSNYELRSLNGDPPIYGKYKYIYSPSIWEPYVDQVQGDKSELFLMTTFDVPIMVNGKYIGMVAMDLTLSEIQKYLNEIHPYEGSYAIMISNGGLIAGHPDEELYTKPFGEIYAELEKSFKITEKVKKGESLSFIHNDNSGKELYLCLVPISVKNNNTPWAIIVSVPTKVIMAKANKTFFISIGVGLIGILLLVFVIFIISKNITNPVSQITKLLTLLSKGHIDKKMFVKLDSGDEIEEMAEALNISIEGLHKKVEFANQIGAGQLNSTFDLLSNDDVLGQSLIEMRNSLLKARDEEESRRIEDEKRRWTNEGLAKFAEILRQNNNNLDVLANEIIRNLIYFINSNQGGIFIVNDQDRNNVVLELLAAFAFNRKKYLKRQIHLGEGLVGACAVEKETIHLTEIPQDYVKITSGLGGSNPNSLLLVPLLIENEMLGVIEIASFNKFEKHEIEFVEKVAQSIASTLKSVRINIRTSQLLEQSQQQSEEMAAQEEEMRQNMEELQATQEESARREAEFKGTLDAIDHFLLKAEFNFNGDLLHANNQFLFKFDYSINEIKGLKHTAFIPEKDSKKFQEIWRSVISGSEYQEKMNLKLKSGRSLPFIISINPVYIDDEIDKIILMAVDLAMFTN